MSFLNKIKQWLSTEEIAESKTENTFTNAQPETTELQPENSQTDDVKTEEPQSENSSIDDAKTEELQPENSPVDDAKIEEPQPENSQTDDVKTEEPQSENSPIDDAKTEEPQPKIILLKLTTARDFSRSVLEELINTHEIYHDGLVDALRGKNLAIYNATDSRNAKQCTTLGCWLTEHEHLLAPYSEYAVVVDMHNAFHDRASYVLERHRHGSFAEAVLLLRKDVAVLSDEMEQALIRLYQQIQAA